MRESGELVSLIVFTCLGGTQGALGTLQVGGSKRVDDRDVDENAAVREKGVDVRSHVGVGGMGGFGLS